MIRLNVFLNSTISSVRKIKLQKNTKQLGSRLTTKLLQQVRPPKLNLTFHFQILLILATVLLMRSNRKFLLLLMEFQEFNHAKPTLLIRSALISVIKLQVLYLQMLQKAKRPSIESLLLLMTSFWLKDSPKMIRFNSRWLSEKSMMRTQKKKPSSLELCFQLLKYQQNARRLLTTQCSLN